MRLCLFCFFKFKKLKLRTQWTDFWMTLMSAISPDATMETCTVSKGGIGNQEAS